MQMKNWMSRFIFGLIVLNGFLSCQQVKEQKESKLAEPDKSEIEEIATAPNLNRKEESANRTAKIATDTITFVEYDDNGDYPLLYAKKGGKRLTFIYDNQNGVNFLRDDQLLIKWKLDSTWIAGDGEALEMRPWIAEAKKIKDGSVANYRKKNNKPIKYWYSEDESYSNTFEDYLYTWMEYYLANTKNKLVKLNLNANSDLVYSIENGQKNGRSYTMLGLATESEGHSSIMVWLYLDNETRKFYEYDLGEDKLVEFK
ncbi:MAG: hypothetical protein ACOH1O_06260 [Flavobacterium sp.]